jgi:alkyl sulfatase BDS1-like metallo-beta-lactamase superfamily hydrolase
MRKTINAWMAMVVLTVVNAAAYSAEAAGPKEATSSTKQINAELLDSLTFNVTDDFVDAKRGLIAQDPELVVRDVKGNAVWDMAQYSFIKEGSKSPTSVNPSLWRQAQINNIYGLFKVTDHIYQVRGYDVSNISFIEGKTGYIVIDPLVSVEVAKASLDLLYKHVGKKPVVAVIYTHSHVDHWGGVKGVVSEKDAKSGKVKVVASQGFLEAAISENVFVGNAMNRRAFYMYGTLLPKGPKGHVDNGLGKYISDGSVTIIPPTNIISKTGQTLTIDGVKIVFQYTPDTEAPTEMNFYFPQFKALCMAENCTHNLHNLYTLRGAKVRDAKAWSYFLNEAIDLFGDKTEVMFASHQWPRWGRENVVEMLKSQRDLYKYLHDQTLRLANQGYNMTEIAEMVKLPEPLAREWYNRGYYGSISHDVKAIFQRYLGWFDGNPANLNQLPPVEAGKKYVEFMGGSAEVMKKARKAYEKGEYRWVAQVINHVVFAEPHNQEARNLEADALEQLGYQSESGPWRNFYLTGALELRKGVQKNPNAATTSSPDVLASMPLDLLFDYLALHLDGPRATGKTININYNFKDTGQRYLLTLENCVLLYFPGRQAQDADATFTLKLATFYDVIGEQASVKDKLASGEIVISGDKDKYFELFSLLDKFDNNFPIMNR